MQMQFKPMLYIGTISIPLFMWAAYRYIDGNVITVTFPFWGTHNVSELVFWTCVAYGTIVFSFTPCGIQIIRKALNIAPMN